ncbi:KGK domain-containing protein [Nostoc sp.]|uniref:KGK domain-containing protein n=1 Tax=Nostoc sp. TaxID=1180 RepID=UPI002FF75FBB
MNNRYRFGLDSEDRLGLSDQDVVSLHAWPCFGVSSIVKLGELMYAANSWIAGTHGNNIERLWFLEEGFRCEILRTKGGGWQKGRFRFRLEFIPDNPEVFLEDISSKNGLISEKPPSPLADLRSELKLDIE